MFDRACFLQSTSDDRTDLGTDLTTISFHPWTKHEDAKHTSSPADILLARSTD